MVVEDNDKHQIQAVMQPQRYTSVFFEYNVQYYTKCANPPIAIGVTFVGDYVKHLWYV